MPFPFYSIIGTLPENLQTTILYLNYDLDEIQRSATTVDFRLRPLASA